MQLRAQALALRSAERRVGITAPKTPHFRLLQSNPELKVMLAQCHEVIISLNIAAAAEVVCWCVMYPW